MFDYWQYTQDRQFMYLGMFVVITVGGVIGIGILTAKDKVIKWLRGRK